MFASTLPQSLPAPLSPSRALMGREDSRLDLDSLDGLDDAALVTRLTSLTPSLLQDLQRFEADGTAKTELVEVLAACVRHTQALGIVLRRGQRVVSLTAFPIDKLVHCVVPMSEFIAGDLAELKVLQVEPARVERPGPVRLGADTLGHFGAMSTLMWEIALRGSRNNLLPELAGRAAFRIAPGVILHGLRVPGAMANAITKLRRQTCNMSEIAGWPGLNGPRAARLINALYLQSALIVSRTHPAATNEGWIGYK